MKNLIFILVIGLAFSATAQEKSGTKKTEKKSRIELKVETPKDSGSTQKIIDYNTNRDKEEKLEKIRENLAAAAATCKSNRTSFPAVPTCADFENCFDTVGAGQSGNLDFSSALKENLEEIPEEGEKPKSNEDIANAIYDDLSKTNCDVVLSNGPKLASMVVGKSADTKDDKSSIRTQSDKIAAKYKELMEADQDADEKIQRTRSRYAADLQRLQGEVATMNVELDEQLAKEDKILADKKQLMARIRDVKLPEAIRAYTAMDQKVKQECYSKAELQVKGERAILDAKIRAGVAIHKSVGDAISQVPQTVDMQKANTLSAFCLNLQDTRAKLNDELTKKNNQVSDLQIEYNMAANEVAKTYTDKELAKSRVAKLKSAKQQQLNAGMADASKNEALIDNQRMAKKKRIMAEIQDLENNKTNDEQDFRVKQIQSQVAEKLLNKCQTDAETIKTQNIEKFKKVDENRSLVFGVIQQMKDDKDKSKLCRDINKGSDSSSWGMGNRSN